MIVVETTRERRGSAGGSAGDSAGGSAGGSTGGGAGGYLPLSLPGFSTEVDLEYV